MPRQKRVKGYWLKKKERFSNSEKARRRAGDLRVSEHVAHVKTFKQDDSYMVTYSVAKWYLEELEKSGLSL